MRWIKYVESMHTALAFIRTFEKTTCTQYPGYLMDTILVTQESRDLYKVEFNAVKREDFSSDERVTIYSIYSGADWSLLGPPEKG